MGFSMAAEYKRRPGPAVRISGVTRSLALLVLVALPAFARLEIPVAPLSSHRAVSLFTAPALATDGEHYFAVWNDTREELERATYGARLTAEGELLDPVGVRLTDGFGMTSVAYGDGRYFAVDGSLRFAVVDRQAKVLARGRVAEEATNVVRVLFNGRDFVVLWGEGDVRVAVLSRDGEVVSAPSAVVPPQPFDRRFHDAATNGSRIVVLYARGVDLYAATLAMSGETLVTETLIERDVWVFSPSIASANGTFAAIWSPLEGFAIDGVRLDAEGRPVGEPVTVTAGGGARLLAAGGAYRIVTADPAGTHVRLVSRTLSDDLTAIGPAIPLFSRSPLSLGASASLAGPGGILTVASVEDPNRNVPEEGLYAATDDAPAAAKLVSRAAMTQRDPALAAGSDGTLIAWRDVPEPRVLATFLRRDGGRFTFELGRAREEPPSVAAVGDTYLAGWNDDENTYARLVRDGAPLGEAIVLDTSARAPVVAADGREFVVAWSAFPVTGIRVVRITVAGEIVAETTVPFVSFSGLPRPALACDRGECVLAWRNERATFNCMRFACLILDSEVVAQRFDSALRPLDAQPILLGKDASSERYVAAAAHDGTYAVSWQRTWRVYTRTIARDGTLSPVLDVEGTRPALARQGSGWLLARELRDELLIRRVQDDGGVLSPDLGFFRDTQGRRAPAVAASGADVLLAYERTTRDEAAGGVPRIYLTGVNPPDFKRRATRH
jgi:hypothetical protein